MNVDGGGNVKVQRGGKDLSGQKKTKRLKMVLKRGFFWHGKFNNGELERGKKWKKYDVRKLAIMMSERAKM